jgi:probable F420-dependent oxidoreductase
MGQSSGSPLVISTSLPNCREGRLVPIGSISPDGIREIAERAEALGYDSLWLNEFLQTDPSVSARFDDAPSYFDPIVTIAALAEHTRRIRFFTSTLVLPLHEPALLAKQVATLDRFSNGRVTLGIGLGGSAEEYRRMRGEIPSPNRGEMLDEYLSAMQAIWTDRRATYAGKYVKFEDLEVLPKPIQNPLPIYMAGTADGVYRRIARFGQGWIDTVLRPDALKAAISTISGYWADAKRTGSPGVARQFYLSIAESEGEARSNFEKALAGARPVPAPPADWEMTIIGSAKTVAERIAEYVRAGVTEVCAIFYAPDVAATVRQMELFTADMLPTIRKAAES